MIYQEQQVFMLVVVVDQVMVELQVPPVAQELVAVEQLRVLMWPQPMEQPAQEVVVVVAETQAEQVVQV